MEGADLAALIAEQPAGHSLAQPFYRDPRFFERDIERIFMRHWLCAGHASSLPRRGDYFLAEYGAESVIVARGEDGELRALVNVCRHRGSRICSAPGNARSLSCPYHGWTYGLDGKLLAARHMPADFDLGSHGLRRIELRVVAGLILISFAEHPLGLALAEKTIASCFEPYGWSEARVAQRKTYGIDANWKLAVENYLECYHCSPAHPEYSRLHALEQPLVRIEALDARMRERSAALGLDIPTREHWDPSSRGEEAVFGFRYPLYDEVLTGSRDGKPVAPLMGGLRDYDGGVTSVHFGPASFFIAYGDHGVIYRFVPKAVDRSELEVIWLVRGDAREGVDYDLEALTWLWEVTSVADKRIIEENQRGVNSRFYAPGAYAPMEPNARRYVAWYLDEIT
ncbi:MAG TPA: aromatic ring-hydroxylating dioxygenase subunit alpha [Stellaceae bacterium]|nr:aromatic ring-hydroxylating dioxygenase subunit alpha [Stellaceae bacterium]